MIARKLKDAIYLQIPVEKCLSHAAWAVVTAFILMCASCTSDNEVYPRGTYTEFHQKGRQLAGANAVNCGVGEFYPNSEQIGCLNDQRASSTSAYAFFNDNGSAVHAIIFSTELDVITGYFAGRFVEERGPDDAVGQTYYFSICNNSNVQEAGKSPDQYVTCDSKTLVAE